MTTRSFDTLTYDQQLERLTEAAQHVLADYGLAGAHVTPLMYINNAVFAVQMADARYALRLLRRGGQRESWLRSELLWLDVLCRETRLCVPRPVYTRHGAFVTRAQVEGLDTPLLCALFDWVEGEAAPSATITLAQVESAGVFLATLHNHAQGFQPPPGFERPRLDWEGLFGEESPYNPGAGAQLFTADHLAVFEAVAEQVRVVMQTLGQDAEHFGLIHADFIAKNMLFQGETVCALDFDSCAYGYYLYDLAPPLLQWSSEPHYAALKDALWAGYTAVRPLPAQHRAAVETFVAARHVASCRWIAGNLENPKIRARASEIVHSRVGELRLFLQSGRLERQSDIF